MQQKENITCLRARFSTPGGGMRPRGRDVPPLAVGISASGGGNSRSLGGKSRHREREIPSKGPVDRIPGASPRGPKGGMSRLRARGPARGPEFLPPGRGPRARGPEAARACARDVQGPGTRRLACRSPGASAGTAAAAASAPARWGTAGLHELMTVGARQRISGSQ